LANHFLWYGYSMLSGTWNAQELMLLANLGQI
jgi:hypothetical protein